MALPDTLVSDVEREHAVDRLREAAGEGRLTTEELSDRVDRAYAARTRGQLDGALVGLPRPAAPRARRGTREGLQRLALWFIPPNLICISVWAATGAHGDFWPAWVLLGTGIKLVYSAREFLEPRTRTLPPSQPGLPRLPPPPPGSGGRRRP